MTDDGHDPFRLGRFVTAQATHFEAALAEIRRGDKRTHWMWFVFPQVAGLGHSETSRYYAIGGLAEARAYLRHPLLGDRLERCIVALDALAPTSAVHVFGSVDAAKLRSSLTLFVRAGGGPRFVAALDRWFDGAEDEATVRLLSAAG